MEDQLQIGFTFGNLTRGIVSQIYLESPNRRKTCKMSGLDTEDIYNISSSLGQLTRDLVRGTHTQSVETARDQKNLFDFRMPVGTENIEEVANRLCNHIEQMDVNGKPVHVDISNLKQFVEDREEKHVYFLIGKNDDQIVTKVYENVPNRYALDHIDISGFKDRRFKDVKSLFYNLAMMTVPSEHIEHIAIRNKQDRNFYIIRLRCINKNLLPYMNRLFDEFRNYSHVCFNNAENIGHKLAEKRKRPEIMPLNNLVISQIDRQDTSENIPEDDPETMYRNHIPVIFQDTISTCSPEIIEDRYARLESENQKLVLTR